jgi:hypothetical protein
MDSARIEEPLRALRENGARNSGIVKFIERP